MVRGKRGPGQRLEPLVTVEEAAAFLGIQPGTAYLWAETGRIPSYKVGALRRFRLSDLERHLNANREGPSSPSQATVSRPGGMMPGGGT